MLKIKDNVDLEMLGAYGFVKKFNNIIHCCYWVRPADLSELKNFRDAFVWNKEHILYNSKNVTAILNDTREIKNIEASNRFDEDCPFNETKEEYIQDLIQAGLVEKVEG